MDLDDQAGGQAGAQQPAEATQAGLPPLRAGARLGPGRRYTVVRELNSGATATVYAALDTASQPPGRSVAIKVLAPHVPMRVVEAEVNATRVRHLGVVQPLGMFVEGSTVCVLFRLVAGRDLLDTLNQAGGRFPEARTRRYMWQVCSIVAALHRGGLCHRDLKAENLVVEAATDCVALIDFGLSKCTLVSGCATLGVGTPDYMAPEVLNLKPELARKSKYDGFAVDVWSLGVLTYVCLLGYYPFEEKTGRGEINIATSLRKISSGQYTPLPTGVCSAECADFIASTLSVDSRSRPRIDQLLTHGWFRAGGYTPQHADSTQWPPPEPQPVASRELTYESAPTAARALKPRRSVFNKMLGGLFWSSKKKKGSVGTFD